MSGDSRDTDPDKSPQDDEPSVPTMHIIMADFSDNDDSSQAEFVSCSWLGPVLDVEGRRRAASEFGFLGWAEFCAMPNDRILRCSESPPARHSAAAPSDAGGTSSTTSSVEPLDGASGSSLYERNEAFPHCAVCGFKCAAPLVRYRRPNKSKPWIYRYSCRRRKCNKFFGHHYTCSINGDLELQKEDPGFTNLPFYNAPDLSIPSDEYVNIHIFMETSLFEAEAARRKNSKKRRLTQNGRQPPETSNGVVSEPATKLRRSCTDSALSSSNESADPSNQPISRHSSSNSNLRAQLKPPKLPQKGRACGSSIAPPVPVPNSAAEIHRRHHWTQTGDIEHQLTTGFHEVLTSPITESSERPKEVSLILRRLMVAGKVVAQSREAEHRMKAQMAECKQQCRLLLETVNQMSQRHLNDSSSITEWVHNMIDEITASKNDSLDIVSKAIREFTENAKEFKIKTEKDELNLRKFTAHNSELKRKLEIAENQANKFELALIERDRGIQVGLAKRLELEAQLKDELFLKDNSSCPRCTEFKNKNEFFQKMAREKAALVDKAEKEKRKLMEELADSKEAIAKLTKEQKMMKFERDAYENDNKRLLAKVEALKKDAPCSSGAETPTQRTPLSVESAKNSPSINSLSSRPNLEPMKNGPSKPSEQKPFKDTRNFKNDSPNPVASTSEQIDKKEKAILERFEKAKKEKIAAAKTGATAPNELKEIDKQTAPSNPQKDLLSSSLIRASAFAKPVASTSSGSSTQTTSSSGMSKTMNSKPTTSQKILPAEKQPVLAPPPPAPTLQPPTPKPFPPSKTWQKTSKSKPTPPAKRPIPLIPRAEYAAALNSRPPPPQQRFYPFVPPHRAAGLGPRPMPPHPAFGGFSPPCDDFGAGAPWHCRPPPPTGDSWAYPHRR